MHIAILTGGISTERIIALRSAANMKDWCEKSGHTTEIFDFPSDMHRFLRQHQATTLAKHFPTKNLRKYLENHQDFDLVIPMFHGIYGEDGQVTAFLTTLGYRYAYSDFTVHALCMDKYKTNIFVEKMGIRIPRSFFVERGYTIDSLCSPLVCYPVIVKPNRGGSSVATSKVSSVAELITAQKAIIDDDIIIQECIEGREFTVGVYRDTDGFHVLPIVEICTNDGFFDYEEKYETDGSNEVFAELEENIKNPLESMSLMIASGLDCKGVVRIDWRYDGKDFYFLEVNTIPGFTSASLVPKMWKKAGKSEKEFVEMLFC
ncbi:MAG: ATP-grasp domain-containing protein [Candidatus Gracilibacteria bacterium]|nr:ATP-grasp domain-containing protein [Candidatus Gracilibacteria bacterium]